MKILFIVFVCVVALLSPEKCTSNLTIIEKKKAGCAIIVPSKPAPLEKLAARDLKRYLRKISGAKTRIFSERVQTPKVKIYIGKSNAARDLGLWDKVERLADDGYLTLINSDAAYLIGEDALATRFAVFGFLEDHLGVRWYMPGEIGEVVPHTEDVVLREGMQQKEPSFKMRWVGNGDWALRNRMNVGIDNDLGLGVHKMAHTFRDLCPVEKYFDKNPEYFALVDGKRTRYKGKHKNQLCTSNPLVMDLVVRNAYKTLNRHPNLDVITLFPNDGLGFCECTKCRALDDTAAASVEDANARWSELGPERSGLLSRRMATFYVQAADRILNEYPNKYVQVGAYSAYRSPPGNFGLKGPEHSIVLITRNDCHDLPIEDGKCNEPYRDAINGWKRIFPLFSAYEYYWKHAALELPYPIVHSISKDIPFYHRKGCFGLYTQYSDRNVGTLLLNYYVAAKLLWDVNADVGDMLEEFYQKFYGPAWKPMKAYHETLEDAVVKSKIHLPGQYHELPLIFTPETLGVCDAALSEAQKAVRGDARIARRVDMARISLGYVKIVMDYVRCLVGASEKWPSWSKEKRQAKERAREILDYIRAQGFSNCFNTPLSPYMKRFLDCDRAIKAVHRKTQNAKKKDL